MEKLPKKEKLFFEKDLLGEEETFFISEDGLKKLEKIYDPKEPTKHVLWTNDYRVELPIRMDTKGPKSRWPYTLIDSFQNTVRNYPDNLALCVKREGK